MKKLIFVLLLLLTFTSCDRKYTIYELKIYYKDGQSELITVKTSGDPWLYDKGDLRIRHFGSGDKIIANYVRRFEIISTTTVK